MFSSFSTVGSVISFAPAQIPNPYANLIFYYKFNAGDLSGGVAIGKIANWASGSQSFDGAMLVGGNYYDPQPTVSDWTIDELGYATDNYISLVGDVLKYNTGSLYNKTFDAPTPGAGGTSGKNMSVPSYTYSGNLNTTTSFWVNIAYGSVGYYSWILLLSANCPTEVYDLLVYIYISSISGSGTPGDGTTNVTYSLGHTGLDVSQNTWNHIAVTLSTSGSNTTVITIYLNGNSVFSQNEGHGTSYHNGQVNHQFLGSNVHNFYSAESYFADYRFYNKALSPDEISQLYNNTYSPIAEQPSTLAVSFFTGIISRFNRRNLAYTNILTLNCDLTGQYVGLWCSGTNYYSSDYGITMTAISGVAGGGGFMSTNGQYWILSSSSGVYYNTSYGGGSWTLSDLSLNINEVEINSSGTVAIASIKNPNRTLWYSTNQGQNWNHLIISGASVSTDFQYYRSFCTNSDSSIVVVMSGNQPNTNNSASETNCNGKIISYNGTTWSVVRYFFLTKPDNESSQPTAGTCATNSTGQYILVSDTVGYLYISNDYGASFNVVNSNANESSTILPTGNIFSGLTMDTTGQYMAVVSNVKMSIFYSYDYGVTWNSYSLTQYINSGKVFDIKVSGDAQSVYITTQYGNYNFFMLR